MPAGSRPLSRSPSRAPSADSMAKLRWIARRALNVTAIQNSPAAARVRRPRSGSRAKANSTSTSTANGAIWLAVTRERASMRRSLPATRTASLNNGRNLRGERLGLVDLAADDGELAAGDGAGPLELVGREDDGAAAGRRLPHEVVDQVAPGGVEPGVGFVEEPELRAAGDEDGQRGAAALPGREPG